MKHLKYIILTALLYLLPSCGEDRTGEFYALIEDRMWIEEVMLENYLWYQEIPTIEDENDYFQEPATFFKKLLYKGALNGKGDNYSYLEETATVEEEASRSISLNRHSTYGIEFYLTKDPTGTSTHTFARILYVLPESPADKAGLQRGDWLSAVNGKRITNSNYSALQQGSELTLARNFLTEQEGKTVWHSTDTLCLSASIPMEINPFLVDTVYQVNNQKIAYLMYNDFATGPENKGSETLYTDQMKQIFSRFKAQSPDAFILDLRYNPGGFLNCAQALGSMLAPSSALGKTFINLIKNDKASPQKVSYPFDNQYADVNLNLNKIYILTSSYTASASEAVINGLTPYMGTENVILLGEKTEGKNVAMTGIENQTYGFILWPVTAYVLNANDEGDYIDGIQPHYQLNERNDISPWYPLGDTHEYLLKNTLSLITTGSLSDTTTPTAETSNTLYSSVTARSVQGLRIH